MAKYLQPKKDPFKKDIITSLFEKIIKHTEIPSDFNPLPSKPPEQKFRKDDMMWRKQDGTMMLASEMQPDHMFYALRLQYNRLAPIARTTSF